MCMHAKHKYNTVADPGSDLRGRGFCHDFVSASAIKYLGNATLPHASVQLDLFTCYNEAALNIYR